MNIFEYAAKHKIRFGTNKGLASVEDLYELPKTKLNEIWQKLKQEQQSSTVPSLLDSAAVSSKSHLLEVQIALIEHVFQTRKEAEEAAQQRAEKRQTAANRLATLEAIAAQKEVDQLGAESLENIQKMIAEAKAALV